MPEKKTSKATCALALAVALVAAGLALAERQLAPRSPAAELAYLAARERAHLAQPVLPVRSLPEVAADGLTLGALEAATRDWSVPCVVRRGAAGAAGAWSLASLRARHSGEAVVVKERFDDNGSVWWTHANRTLGEFVDALESGRAPAPTVVLGMSILAKGTLSRDVAAPIDDVFVGGSKTEQLVVTPDGFEAFYHDEPGVNVYKLVAGEKRWTFVPPNATAALCPRDFGGGALQTCLRALDAERLERWLSRVPRYAADIGAGDVLVNVPWWRDAASRGDFRELSGGEQSSPTRVVGGTTSRAAAAAARPSPSPSAASARSRCARACGTRRGSSSTSSPRRRRTRCCPCSPRCSTAAAATSCTTSKRRPSSTASASAGRGSAGPTRSVTSDSNRAHGTRSPCIQRFRRRARPPPPRRRRRRRRGSRISPGSGRPCRRPCPRARP